MFGKFKASAEAAGNTEVKRFKAKAEAIAFIEGYLKKEGIMDTPGSFAVWADSPFLKGIDIKVLATRIPGLKFEVTRDTAKNSKIGITQMEWGLANMGTMAQDSTRVEQRLASSLPLIHIALLVSGNIVADLPSLMKIIGPRKAAFLALITGPSKTADIERVLAIGVHGPERLVIVCVDEIGGAD
jgi:L-lactate dehydrogenase complex protein LldG